MIDLQRTIIIHSGSTSKLSYFIVLIFLSLAHLYISVCHDTKFQNMCIRSASFRPLILSQFRAYYKTYFHVLFFFIYSSDIVKSKNGGILLQHPVEFLPLFSSDSCIQPLLIRLILYPQYCIYCDVHMYLKTRSHVCLRLIQYIKSILQSVHHTK